jgi:hypothetical protein
MTKQEILEMTGLSEQEFYQQYPTQEAFEMAMGGMVEEYKKGGWIQKATASIKKRGTEGKCTPMSKPGCTGRALALAKTFHKMAAKRKKKEEGGYVDMYGEGSDIDLKLNKLKQSESSNFQPQGFLTRDPNSNMFIGGLGFNYRGDNNLNVSPYLVGVGNEYFKKIPADYGMRVSYPMKNVKPFINIGKNPNAGVSLTFEDGGKIPDNVLRSRLESHMSPGEAQDYIDSYAQGGVVDVYQLMGMPTPEMYEMGGYAMMEDYGRGGMIKRKDGSYSRRGLWDNIRANKGSGRKPTKEMLKQERKIRAAEKKEYGGMVDAYGMGGTTKIGDLSHVISMKNHSNMGMAMGGAINYPEGLQMPIFAMGGMPEKEPMSLKDKYNQWLNAKPKTKYASGGMAPHPEIGIDPSGTVPTKSGDINVERGESMWNVGNSQFIGTKAKTESMLKDYNNRDLIALASKFNAIEREKAQKEAKDAQIAALEEQKAGAAMNRIVAKYGGAIKRMYARGGMVPRYDGGAGVRLNPYYDFNSDGYGPMTNPMPGINSYLQGFQDSMPMAPMRTLNSIGAAVNPLSIAEPQYQLMGASEVSDAYKNVNKPLRGEGTYPAFYSRLTGAGLDESADASTAGTTANKSTGAGMGTSQMDKYLMAAQFLPAAYNLGRGIFEKAWKPGSYETPADTKWQDMTGEAGRKGMLGAYMANKYNARQIGGSNALAALQSGTNTYQQNLAAYEEALENRNRMGRMETDRLNKAIQQSNMQMRMNRDYLAQQARENKVAGIGKGLENIGQGAGQLWQNKQMMDALRMAYPPSTNTTVPGLSDIDINSYTAGGNRTTGDIGQFKFTPDTSIPALNRMRAIRKFK